MLTPVWYCLLFMLQVAQMDPAVEYSRLNLDLFIDSQPVWTVTVKGNAREGMLYDGKQLLGEYDASSRISQAYMIYPRSLPPDRESGDQESAGATSSATGGKAAAGTPKTTPAGTDAGAGTAAADGATAELPGVFALDFTGLVRQLKSAAREGSLVLVPDLPLDNAKGEPGKSAGSKAAKTPAKTGAMASPTAPARSATPAPGSAVATGDQPASAAPQSGGDGQAEDVLELRRYPNRTILTWPAQGIVLVLTRR